MNDVFLCRRGVFTLRAALAVFCLVLLGATGNSVYGQTNWVAPAGADSYKNPYLGNSGAIAAGKTLFQQLCAICHGNKGKGDGMAGMSLKPRPANLASKRVQAQTDGAIYWKLTEGNPPMASYNEALTEQQRWQLVNYIRQLGGK